MIKKTILWIHKWLGLLSGLVIVIISLTGSIYVFHDDLKLMFYPEKYYLNTPIPNDSSQPLPVSTLTEIAQKALLEDEEITRIDLYPAKNRTWVFRAVQTDEDAWTYASYFVYNKRVFVNPYNGEIQKIENSKTEFFQLILQMHLNLLLGKKIGKSVVAISTILFVILTLSGLVLWWPKKWTRKKIRKHFRLDWSAKWKRLNYDFHNVLGFYSLLIALLLGFTGLVFAYPSLKSTYIYTFNQLEDSNVAMHQTFDFVPQPTSHTLDNALKYVLQKHSEADMMSIRLKKNAEVQDIQVRLKKDRTGRYLWYYFNQKDGQITEVKSSAHAKLGDRMAGMNYDLHVGNFGGIFTKIMYFIASLICASLPITGFIIWINKQKKLTKKRKKSNKKFSV